MTPPDQGASPDAPTTQPAAPSATEPTPAAEVDVRTSVALTEPIVRTEQSDGTFAAVNATAEAPAAVLAADLEALTVPELRDRAGELDVEIPGDVTRKSDLVDLIAAAAAVPSIDTGRPPLSQLAERAAAATAGPDIDPSYRTEGDA